jgi:diamine N-acetyltransferase
LNLKGEHIFLRALEPSDLEMLYYWENDPAIWRVSNTFAPFSRFVLEQYLVNAHEDIFTSKQVRLMICLQDNKEIGTIELFDFDPLHQRVGIGILIAKDAENKGFATQALQLLLKYCFEVLLVKQVFCNISAENEKSLHLFDKLGFVRIGLKKQWLRKTQDSFEDEWMLQLVK